MKLRIDPIRIPTVEEIKIQDISNNNAIPTIVIGLNLFVSHILYSWSTFDDDLMEHPSTG